MMEIILELSDFVAMQSKHTMSLIFYKILATCLPISYVLIENNTTTQRKTTKKRRNYLILSLLNKTADPKIMKMLLALND